MTELHRNELCHPEQTVQEVLVTTSSRRALAAAKRRAAIGHEPERQAFSLSFLPFVKLLAGMTAEVL